MGKVHTEIDDNVRKFIEDQQVFFVATAPLDPNGHVNLSPKGLDSLRILGPKRVAYVDLIGSGVETVAHLKDNGAHRNDVLCVPGSSERRANIRTRTGDRIASVGIRRLGGEISFVRIPQGNYRCRCYTGFEFLRIWCASSEVRGRAATIAFMGR